MNKQIEHLFNAAGFHKPEMERLGIEHKFEKFAELIVQECVKFCVHESNDDEHDEYDMGMWVKAESIKAAIMKEFGIKE